MISKVICSTHVAVFAAITELTPLTPTANSIMSMTMLNPIVEIRTIDTRASFRPLPKQLLVTNR